MLFVWIGFVAFVLLMLALDLGVFHRKAHVVGVREALAWSALWISIFAVDSIPAIFAITADPFLVFTSNVFAILGLRSLYFALAGAIAAFRYLKLSLALVLALVGVKMLAHSWLKGLLGPSFNLCLLLVVLAILAAAVVASWLHRPRAFGPLRAAARSGRPTPAATPSAPARSGPPSCG